MTDSKSVPRMIVYLMLTAGCVLISIPYFVTITTALKSTGEIYAAKPRILPEQYHFSNFRVALFGSEKSLGRFNFLICLKNSVCVVLLNVIGTVLSCSLVAYGFARFNSR